MMKLLCLLSVLVGFYASASETKPTIIGGRYALEGEFPEAVYISSGNARCSSTVVGPRVLMTAAHCTTDNGEIVPVSEERHAYMFVHKQVVYRATCKISEKYATEDHDMALCLVNQDVNTKWASVVERNKGVHLNDQTVHAGYGCVDENGNGGNDGRLKVGVAIVTRLSNPPQNHWWYSLGDGVCFGDSGGGAYMPMADYKKDKHFLVGITSRGNIKDLNLLTDLASNTSQDFMLAWSSSNNAKICGFNKDCESGKPDPKPDPNPKKCKDEKEKIEHYQHKVEKYQLKVEKWQKKLEQCLQEEDEDDLNFLNLLN